MPFLGRDWRSDGECWVKTDRGWETLKNWRVKVHENINYNVLQKLLRQSIQQPEKSEELIECSQRSLYIRIHRAVPPGAPRCESEVVFSQVLSTLDLAGAFKDIRRSNYAFKILDILITDKLTKLNGCVQIQLFSLLEAALISVQETQANKQQLVSLLEKLVFSLKENHYSFTHQGGGQLWSKHFKDATQMLDAVRNIRIKERGEDGKARLTELPDEVIRQILLYLCSQQDLVNSGKASTEIQSLVADNRLWRDLCMSHYTRQQLNQIGSQHKDVSLLVNTTSQVANSKDINWYKVYTRLARKYGQREDYSDGICWCTRCSMLYWKLTGHPCMARDTMTSENKELTPEQFINMFNV